MLSDQYEPKYNKESTGKREKELRAKLQLVFGFCSEVKIVSYSQEFYKIRKFLCYSFC